MDATEEVSKAGAEPADDDGRTAVVKAYAINYADNAASQLMAPGENAQEDLGFTRAGAILPPYPPDFLCKQLENSNCLRQNIDAMETNVDGFGHRFVPVIDLAADDADDRIADAIYLERLDAAADAGATPGTDDDDAVALPTAGEIAKRRAEMEAGMRKEKARLQAWFDFCCHDHSFVALRRQTRADRELLGYGYWEPLRNKFGKIMEIRWAPAQTVRLRPLQKEVIEVKVKIKTSPIAYREIPKRMRFRSYVQIVEGRRTFFKEFGDPRTMSSRTGKYYVDGDALQRAEKKRSDVDDVQPATELIHFKIPSARGAYGVPRWIGNLMSVLGSHAMEEVNFLYWDNKSIPPMVIMVEGGRLNSGAAKTLGDTIKNQIKGRSNFHSVLVLEAMPPTDKSGIAIADAKVRIRLEPLTGSLMKDAIFQEYDERNRDKVGESFRIPRILRGDTRDFNRATAESAVTFTEQQVFAPERREFDFWINSHLMPELGARYHVFESLGPSLRDPEAMAKILALFVEKSIMVPGEARSEAHEVLGHELKKVDEEWARTPLPQQLVKARSAAVPGSGDLSNPDDANGDNQGDGQGDGKPPGKAKTKPKVKPAAEDNGDIAEKAAHLITLRDAIAKAETEHAAHAFADAKNALERGEMRVLIPIETMRALVTPKDDPKGA